MGDAVSRFYIPLPQIRAAVHAAMPLIKNIWRKIAAEGERVIAAAREEGKPIIVLAGRRITLTRKLTTVWTA